MCDSRASTMRRENRGICKVAAESWITQRVDRKQISGGVCGFVLAHFAPRRIARAGRSGVSLRSILRIRIAAWLAAHDDPVLSIHPGFSSESGRVKTLDFAPERTTALGRW